jgi:asparagine synthase (glutamine-hydrolysing)
VERYVKIDAPKLAEALTSAVDARDLPGMADVDSSLWLLCRQVKKEYTVALSGECADVMFGGYPWFHKSRMVNADTFPWSVNLMRQKKIMSGELIKLVKPEEYAERKYRDALNEVPSLPEENAVEARMRELLFLNISCFMPSLFECNDRMGMAHGLEIRVPFCDHRLVQYVWNIPWNLKMYKGRGKGILCHAFKGVLPNHVLYRKISACPKTHSPSYEKAVKAKITEIINDPGSPIRDLINLKFVSEIALEESDCGKLWFGQLMATHQMLAYLIQLDYWMRKYKVSVNPSH